VLHIALSNDAGTGKCVTTSRMPQTLLGMSIHGDYAEVVVKLWHQPIPAPVAFLW